MEIHQDQLLVAQMQETLIPSILETLDTSETYSWVIATVVLTSEVCNNIYGALTS